MTLRIAVLGLGEAGSEIARDLVKAGAGVRGYDPLVTPSGGVVPRDSEADAVRDADLVLSVNSASDARTALGNALPAARPGTVWADLNTGSRALKVALAGVAAEHRLVFVDVALMSPVPGNGLRTPMLAAGDGAARYAGALVPLGATVTVLSGPAGDASARKLLRSVFYKGLAAAVVEALDAASAAGCEDWLRLDIGSTLAGFDDRTLDRLVTGSRQHARRRAAEMAAAAEQLTELGVESRIAAATRDLLNDLAGR
ncbi:MAG TPA: DUF1932 domain-containing protein [Rugosimonospora sp.]|nr:DUF1932 domain-containing protein [Rugosimonospora sp.]